MTFAAYRDADRHAIVTRTSGLFSPNHYLVRREGIPSEAVESAPGRANLVARLSGDGSLGGIVLHHHIDVVFADRRPRRRPDIAYGLRAGTRTQGSGHAGTVG